MKTYIDKFGGSITPSDKSFNFKESERGIATWTERQNCFRCGGSGLWKGGFTVGVCYGCGGNGEGTPAKLKGYTEEAYLRYEARRLKSEAKKVEQHEIEQANLLAKFSDEIESLVGLRNRLRPQLERAIKKGGDGFLYNVSTALLEIDYSSGYLEDASNQTIANSWIVKSSKTIDALEKMANRVDENRKKLEKTIAWEEGRFEISGLIKSLKWVDTAYGSTLKMLVELEDGRKCYGSVPSKLDEVDTGDSIVFKATIQSSKDDKHFAFFKRPALVGS